jgi:uncharacterized pyridoxal phosphate-containing UPF0001 family protein
MSISGNISMIEERIQKACDKAGRKRDEITLMCVSKFIPVGKIEEAYRCGIRCFGESRVKEAMEKFGGRNTGSQCSQQKQCSQLTQCSQLHLIGSLQRNKAKQAVLLFDCIQSVDRDELIAELNKHSTLRDTQVDVLL